MGKVYHHPQRLSTPPLTDADRPLSRTAGGI